MTEEVSKAEAEAEAAVAAAVEAGVTPPQTGEGEATISIGDIRGVISIIDICAQRGAYKGEELEAVGALRKRFADFIAQVTPAEEEVPAEEEAVAEESEA